VHRPIADSVGTNVVVEVAIVVELLGELIGIGAPVENRHPAPGGLNAAILIIGGGSFFDDPGGWVVAVVDVGDPTVVVGPDGGLDVVV
jgi:hypothetical protein